MSLCGVFGFCGVVWLFGAFPIYAGFLWYKRILLVRPLVEMGMCAILVDTEFLLQGLG